MSHGPIFFSLDGASGRIEAGHVTPLGVPESRGGLSLGWSYSTRSSLTTYSSFHCGRIMLFADGIAAHLGITKDTVDAWMTERKACQLIWSANSGNSKASESR